MDERTATPDTADTKPLWQRPVIEKIPLEQTLYNPGTNIDSFGGSSGIP